MIIRDWVVGSIPTYFIFCLFQACTLENVMNSYDGVILETSLVARGEVPWELVNCRWDSTNMKPQYLLLI